MAKKLILVVVSAGGVDIDDSRANAVLWAPYGGKCAKFYGFLHVRLCYCFCSYLLKNVSM